MFDRTGQLLTRAFEQGQKVAQWREKLIVEGVQDINSNVYKPSGSASAIYAAGYGTLLTSNQFNETGLDNVEILLARRKDDSISATTTADDFIYINPDDAIVLIPINLKRVAFEYANSTLVPESAENAPNYWKGQFRPLTSPYIGKQSTSTWYYGDFKKDFWWTEVWPLQTFRSKPGSEDEFKKDIKFSQKVRMYGGIGAIDYKHVVKCTA